MIASFMTGSVVKAGKSKQFESVLREEIVKQCRPSEVAGNMLAAFREGDGC